MSIQQWLEHAIKALENAAVATARLDAELLISDTVNKDRAWVLAHPEYVLSDSMIENLTKQLERRSKHEPLAYILCKQEFYGLPFCVTPDTLTPRPETEAIVTLAREHVAAINSPCAIADIGTGSGCIAIALAKQLSGYSCSIAGYDVSQKALSVARKNNELHQAGVAFKQFDITTAPLMPAADMLLANLPYVPADFQINLAATYEPSFAIYGGEDGLEYYRYLFSKLDEKTTWIATESLPPQHNELAKIAKDAGFSLQKTEDFVQVFEKD